MKKITVCIVLFALLAASAVAMGMEREYDPGELLPTGASEGVTWKLNPTTEAWESGNTGARFWASGLTVSGGYYTQASKSFEVTNHVSVAQWCLYVVSANRFDWRVISPGEYAAEAMWMFLMSNNDVSISLSGFANPASVDDSEGAIPAWYGWNTVQGDPADVVWVGANETEDLTIALDPLSNEPYPITRALWSKIEVSKYARSCEYEDMGVITVSLMNMKHWVDPETGGWADPQE